LKAAETGGSDRGDILPPAYVSRVRVGLRLRDENGVAVCARSFGA